MNYMESFCIFNISKTVLSYKKKSHWLIPLEIYIGVMVKK